jgi:hypothetical protein
MHAIAVPVRPWPPQHATSTRSPAAARKCASANEVRASDLSLGSQKSRQRNHRCGHATSRGGEASSSRLHCGSGATRAPARIPRPRRRVPSGSCTHPALIAHDIPRFWPKSSSQSQNRWLLMGTRPRSPRRLTGSRYLAQLAFPSRPPLTRGCTGGLRATRSHKEFVGGWTAASRASWRSACLTRSPSP